MADNFYSTIKDLVMPHTDSYGSYFAPTVEWVKRYVPQVIAATSQEVRHGYPMSSYVDKSRVNHKQEK